MSRSNLPVSRPLNGLKARKAKRAYLAAFAMSGIMSDGLDAAGINIWQLKYWRSIDPEFKELEELVKQRQDDELRLQIRKYILDGNIDMIKAAMKRLPEYNPAKKTEVEVTGEVKHKHVSELPESELDALIRAGAQLVDAEYEVVDNASGQCGGQVPEVRGLPDPSLDRRDS